jgi:hypothetical protein
MDLYAMRGPSTAWMLTRNSRSWRGVLG